ncbi:MAG TPA: DUF2334 domain-containing protein [Holophagaceae bacterium]|jgi:hypothetical protein|nr:DUF2334 domain-containing protein [Holophagaceae bacterium]
MPDSRYLIRFDDICPTMNWAVWEAIEGGLDLHGVKPILAVVPDNQDPKLRVDPPRPEFWNRVRDWQAKGYTIALHGYQHRYVNRNAGLMGLTPNSEFAGLPRADQEAKLRSALAIFAAQGVRVDAWVAPSHSFDKVTVALLAELGVNVISDGLWPRPFTAEGITWIPQQLWSFHPKPAGIWTVCNHHNGWSEARIEQFREALRTYAPRMTDVPAVLREYTGRRLSLTDRWRGFAEFIWTHRIVGPIWDARRRMRERRMVSG